MKPDEEVVLAPIKTMPRESRVKLMKPRAKGLDGRARIQKYHGSATPKNPQDKAKAKSKRKAQRKARKSCR